MAVESAAIRRGAIVLVQLPRDKARPAVVVRSDLFAELAYAAVLPITTELRPGFSVRIDIEASEGTGLRLPSQVMVDWPQTIRLSAIGEVIGAVDLPTMHAITRALALILGIAEGAGDEN